MTKNPPKIAIQQDAHSIYVPLKNCVLSPLNMRSDEVENSELDASIDDVGLLQNLIGYRETNKAKKPTGKVAINGGGSRLRSLFKKLADGLIDEDFPVPVKIIDVKDAVKTSLMENKARTNPHPADELKAFLALADMGHTSKDIGAMFGYAPILITQRLRLATISPILMDLYRKNEATLQQLTALSIVEDHARQEAAWNATPDYQRDPEELRALVTQGETPANSPLGLFVGKDAYLAAGGEFNVDLFAQEGEGFMVNTPLVQQLALEKLTLAVNKIKEQEGLAWAEVSVARPYSAISELRDAPTTQRDFTEEEQAKYDALETRNAKAYDEYQDTSDTEEEEKLSAEIDANEAEMEAMQDMRVMIDPAYATRAGAFFWFNNGVLARSSLKVRPVAKTESESEDDQSEEDADEGAGIAQSQGQPEKKERSAHSDAHTRRMSAHRNAALQKLVADNQKVAFAVMLASILPGVLSDRDWSRKDSTIAIRPPYLKGAAKEIETNEAWQNVQEQIEQAAQMVKAKEGDDSSMFSRLLELPESSLLQLVALCVALSIDVLHGNGDKEVPAAELAKAVNLDMADWWKPTPDAYLNHVSSKHLLAVVTEAVSADAANKMVGLKKAQMVEAAALNLTDTRWVPEMMRTA